MLDDSYRIRSMNEADVATVALHLALMFRDLGLLDEAETEQLREASRPWIEDLLLHRTYVGWFVQCNEVVVGGLRFAPEYLRPKAGLQQWRQQLSQGKRLCRSLSSSSGFGRRTDGVALQWARTQSIHEMTLSASEQAKPLYLRLGFTSDAARHALRL